MLSVGQDYQPQRMSRPEPSLFPNRDGENLEKLLFKKSDFYYHLFPAEVSILHLKRIL